MCNFCTSQAPRCVHHTGSEVAPVTARLQFQLSSTLCILLGFAKSRWFHSGERWMAMPPSHSSGCLLACTFRSGSGVPSNYQQQGLKHLESGDFRRRAILPAHLARDLESLMTGCMLPRPLSMPLMTPEFTEPKHQLACCQLQVDVAGSVNLQTKIVSWTDSIVGVLSSKS